MTVLLIGTLDTKGEELAWVRGLIEARGHSVRVLDAGVLGEPVFAPDVPASDIAEAGGSTLAELRSRGDRGVALDVMARGAAAVAAREYNEGRVAAVLGIGGSCGTAIATSAMRALPVGVPRVMVSTVASGPVGSYVGETDITMMYSVVDIAGLNRISRRILSNAAGALCGMLEQPGLPDGDRTLLAATMFGVTTPCVERVRRRLEAGGYEVLVFHATGSGGRAMEGLIRAGFIAGVADVTTTEWCDELVGGTLSAGPERLGAAGAMGIPQVVSVGALDMVNFGPRATVPERFRDRLLHVHNPSVTLMRTTAAECTQLGEIIAARLNAANGPTTILLPLRGVSALDREGQPFHDAEADAALFEALRRSVGPAVSLVELDLHINDPAFADAIADRLLVTLPEQDHAVHTA
ncbi:MAG TPA: Tm-1-like ATP-binding domain-containing protein [Longimicrobiales bacterium]|nr:Tm-1-like ATP-binding domain-containing protein [Longimicrobiales bacterium]